MLWLSLLFLFLSLPTAWQHFNLNIIYIIPNCSQKSDQGVKKGGEITLSWNDKTAAKAKWMKDGRIIENGGRINITQSKDGKTATLKITGANEADDGEYTLTMSNRKGEQSGSARITVLGAFLLVVCVCVCPSYQHQL